MTPPDPLENKPLNPFDFPLLSPHDRSCRPVLLECIRVMERLIGQYHRSLLHAAPSVAGDDLRGLVDFVDWSTFALARGRALLLMEERPDGASYRYDPPKPGPQAAYADRLLARRAEELQTSVAERWRQRLH